MYSKVAKTKRHFAEDFAWSKFNFICSWFFPKVCIMACRFPHPYGENSEPRNPDSLMKLALEAVPQPGETARALLPPWNSVRIALEKREFDEKRERYRREHEKKFRYVMNELKYVDDLNWTWRLFPSHVLLLLQSNVSVVL